MPAAAHAASTTWDADVRAPVWERAPRTAASERPGASSTTGLPASTSARAAATNARPSTTSSAYIATARVPSCVRQDCIRSTTLTSAWLPTETNRATPRRRSSSNAARSSTTLPLWLSTVTSPGGSTAWLSWRLVPVSTTPRQFGPTSTTPASCAMPNASRSTAAPVSPCSDKPAVITTSERAPASTASRTASTRPADGTQSTTRSTCSPAARATASEGYVGRPSTCPLLRLTSTTGRSPLDSSARRARMCPHFAGSSLAPTTAIEDGSNSASSGCWSAVSTRGPSPAATLDASS